MPIPEAVGKLIQNEQQNHSTISADQPTFFDVLAGAGDFFRSQGDYVSGAALDFSYSIPNDAYISYNWIVHRSMNDLSDKNVGRTKAQDASFWSALSVLSAPLGGLIGEVSSVTKVNPSTLIRTETGRSWKISTEIVADIMKTAKTQGIFKPVEVYAHSGKMYIINGHHRVQAAIRLGIDVPINIVTSPGTYRTIFELQHAAIQASLSPFKVSGQLLRTLLK